MPKIHELEANAAGRLAIVPKDGRYSSANHLARIFTSMELDKLQSKIDSKSPKAQAPELLLQSL